jgi:Tol biopolymer transport system component
MLRTTRYFCFALFTAGLALAQAERSAEVQLKAAMHKEQVEGDLKAAIKLYQSIVEEHADDRAVAAKALLQMGQCYEKLGQADARKAYQQLLAQYADQKEAAGVARARLAVLERAGGLSHPPGITLRKVWEDAGREVDGSPSPDGRYFSCTDRETGDLALQDLVTGQNHRLTKNGSWEGEFAEASEISGDGQQIAYAWYNEENGYELRVSGIDGSNARVIYSAKNPDFYLEPLQWTLDDKQVLAALQRELQRNSRETEIALIPVGGGPLRVLKTLARYPDHASLSPDGRFLVYDAPERADGPERDVFLLSLEGGQETALVRQPFDDYAPVWTPDGKGVLFLSDRTGTTGFWTIDVVEGKPQGTPLLLKDNIGRDVRPHGFTQRGSFYYSLHNAWEDVYVAEVDLEAGKVLREPERLAARFVGSNSAPSWSPDGRRLAYYSRRGESSAADAPTLVILSVESGEAKDVPVRLNQLPYPVRWFPDGRSVLVGAWESPKRDQVAFYRVDTETGDHSLVRAPGPGPARSEVSPDGRTFFFWTGGEPKLRGGLVARDIETGQEREIARVPYLDGRGFTRAVVSPNGRFVAFGAPVEGGQWTALRLVPAMGGELRELFRFRLSEMTGNDEIAWTPDGSNILCVRRTGKDGMPELWRIPITGGEPQRMGLSMKDMKFVTVDPDGRRLAFQGNEGGRTPGEVWVLENFLPTQR